MLNGHLPEGATLVTLELLQQANTTHVKAPALSERVGCDVYVRIRAIRRAVYLQALPPPPKEAATWPTAKPTMTPEERRAALDGWAQAFEAHMQSLPDEERAQRRRATDDVTYKVLVAGVVEPRLTLETAHDFAEDADVIALEILRFSGLLDEAVSPTEVVAGSPA